MMLLTAQGWIAAMARAYAFFVVTYAVHAASWAGVAAALGRASRHSSSARHRLWKLALLGSLLTTIVAASGAPWVDLADFEAVRSVRGTVPVDPSSPADPSSATAAVLGSVSRLGRFARVLAWTNFEGGDRPLVAGAVVVLASVFGLARWAVAAMGFARDIAGRAPLRNARVNARLQALMERTRPRRLRVSACAHLSSPVALGSREICLPSSLPSRLDDAELAGVLAHELAHLERGDGIWLPVFTLLRAVFWFHPVVRWMAAQASQTAELACDDRAVELTRDPVGLARALTRVAAEWMAARPSLLPAIAGTDATHLRGQLSSRVRRLVAAEDVVSRGGRDLPLRGRETLLLGTLALLLSVWPLRMPARPAFSTAPTAHAEVIARPFAPAQAEPSASAHLEIGEPRELKRAMDQLVERERDVALHLAAALAAPSAAGISAEAAPQIQALEQDLRHVHALQAWTEARLVTATDRAALTPRP